MRGLALLTILAACGSSAPPNGPMTVAVTSYDYTFDLTSRAAHATVAMNVTVAGNCVTLPMRATLVGTPTLDGAPATTTVANSTITACGDGWNVGDTATLDADLTVAQATLGPTQVGYSIATDAQNAPFYYLLSWINGCDQFAPCDSAPDKFAQYHFTVTHPSGTQVLCPGTITPGDTSTTCDFTFDGGPTYSTFGIAASPDWQRVDHGTWSDLAVTFYNRTGSGVEPAIDDAWIGGYVHWLEQELGPFPFGNTLRVATAPTYWAGFEHPGNIILSDTLDQVGPLAVTYTDQVNHDMAHEITHQWAGDQTTIAGTYDFAWKESMAEYLTYVYEDMTEPVNAARTTMLWKGWAESATHYPVPTDSPALVDSYGDAYGAGPMVLFRQLEAMYSRDAVLAAIQSLLGHAHAISIDDVRSALEATTGADLSGYFDRWVKGNGAPMWPDFRVAVAQSGSDVTLTLTQISSQLGTYGCAFDIELDGSTPDQVATARVNLGPDGNAQTTVDVPNVGFTVVSHKFDPENECIAQEFTGLVKPRHAPGWSPWARW